MKRITTLVSVICMSLFLITACGGGGSSSSGGGGNNDGTPGGGSADIKVNSASMNPLDVDSGDSVDISWDISRDDYWIEVFICNNIHGTNKRSIYWKDCINNSCSKSGSDTVVIDAAILSDAYYVTFEAGTFDSGAYIEDIYELPDQLVVH